MAKRFARLARFSVLAAWASIAHASSDTSAVALDDSSVTVTFKREGRFAAAACRLVVIDDESEAAHSAIVGIHGMFGGGPMPETDLPVAAFVIADPELGIDLPCCRQGATGKITLTGTFSDGSPRHSAEPRWGLRVSEFSGVVLRDDPVATYAALDRYLASATDTLAVMTRVGGLKLTGDQYTVTVDTTRVRWHRVRPIGRVGAGKTLSWRRKPGLLRLATMTSCPTEGGRHRFRTYPPIPLLAGKSYVVRARWSISESDWRVTFE